VPPSLRADIFIIRQHSQYWHITDACIIHATIPYLFIELIFNFVILVLFKSVFRRLIAIGHTRRVGAIQKQIKVSVEHHNTARRDLRHESLTYLISFGCTDNFIFSYHYIIKTWSEIGETEEGWNNFYITSYISVKNSPILMIFTIEHSQFHRLCKRKIKK
jgi:hypothetical protein